MIPLLDVEAFLQLRSTDALLFDVRSPGEFARGNIYTALNLPALDDAERAEVGTLWTRVDPQQALVRAMEIGAQKLPQLQARVLTLAEEHQTKSMGVHCWRGGLRSAHVAEALAACGLTVMRLEGGYKAFRRFAITRFEEPRKLNVVTGPTGSGKTKFLRELKSSGEQVIDLEALAHHKGSAFGHLFEAAQPTQEQFENELALAWYDSDPARTLWIEDESRNIGRLILPTSLYAQMRAAPCKVLDVSREERIAQLVGTYGQADRTVLRACFLRIEKRCGYERTARALAHLDQGELAAAAEIVLDYYDKAYAHSVMERAR